MKNLLLLLLLLILSAPLKASEKNIHNIKLLGFSDSHIAELRKTFNLLKSLKKDDLKIPESVYKRNSSFKALYGFEFSGEKLFLWFKKRIKSISYYNAWTIGTNNSKGSITLSSLFFKISDLERLYTLIHEARHTDDGGYPHIKCPEKKYPFVSSGSPDMDLTSVDACDKTLKGAYHFHSAFLFECYAFGLIDQKQAGLLYSSSIIRVLPLIR